VSRATPVGVVAGLVLAADQVSKAFVRATIERGEDVDVALGVSLTNVRNTGVAFGLLAGDGWLLALVTAGALVALAAFFVAYARRPLAWLPSGLLLGGALGNLVDRIREGSVTDFVDFPAWPAFNLADVAITLGVLSLLLIVERQPREEAPREHAPDGAA
jgi:signal peptidase II